MMRLQDLVGSFFSHFALCVCKPINREMESTVFDLGLDFEVVDVEAGWGLSRAPAEEVLLPLPEDDDDAAAAETALPAQNVSPAAIAPEAPPQRCPYCEARRQDMLATFPESAARWEAKWTEGGSYCFGACLVNEFCIVHSVPANLCGQDGDHTLLFYHGSWSHVRLRVPVAAAAAAAVGTPSTISQSPADQYEAEHNRAAKRMRSEAGCTECVHRLQKLAACCWAKKDIPFFACITELRNVAATNGCQGFCTTSHVCKVHACPAEIVRDGHRSSKFRCPMPHEATARGRHHEDFAFYCADDACCGGRWYSREESHTRAQKQRTVPIVVQSPHVADRQYCADGESSAKPLDGESSAKPLDGGASVMQTAMEMAEPRVEDRSPQTLASWHNRRHSTKLFRATVGVLLVACLLLLAFLIAVWVLAKPTIHTGTMCWLAVANGSLTERSDGCSVCAIERTALGTVLECNTTQTALSFVGTLDTRTLSVLESWSIVATETGNSLAKGNGSNFPLFASGIDDVLGVWHTSISMNHTSIFSRWMHTWNFVSF